MGREEVVFRSGAGVGTVRRNRRERLTAGTPAMLDAWAAAIETAKRDDRVRAVVLTGTGRGFCSGGDVRAMGAFDDCIINGFIGPGSAAMRIDDFNGNNFDHAGLGFIRRGTLRPTAAATPIFPIRPSPSP